MKPDWIDNLAAAIVATMPAIQAEAHQVAQNEQSPEAGDDLERQRVTAILRESMPSERHSGEVRQLLTAASETVAWLRFLRDCDRAMVPAELATNGARLLHSLSAAVEAVERPLTPNQNEGH